MTKYCPKCGEEQLDNARFCRSCGAELPNVDTSQEFPEALGEKNYTIFIIAGYILSFLMPLFGLIISIYLLTRKDSSKASLHGKIIIIIAILVWVISFLMTF